MKKYISPKSPLSTKLKKQINTKSNPTNNTYSIIDVMNKLQVYLSYRDHSEYELTCKLLKHFNKLSVEKAINIAKKNKWIADPIQLSQQLSNELHNKKKGGLFIQSVLKKKQLPIIPQQELLEKQKCLWWINKKFQTIKSFSNKEINKIYSFLVYRGFKTSIISDVIYEYKNSQAEDKDL